MGILYEVIAFYFGEWGGSCGRYTDLQDAINKQQDLNENKKDKNESYHIIVRF